MTTATNSAETVVPGSHNPAPAPWPPSATTPQSAIDAAAIANTALSALNKALASRDFAAVADLFLPDSAERDGSTSIEKAAPQPYWRDHLVLSWRLRTLKGRAAIQRFLEHESCLAGPDATSSDATNTPAGTPPSTGVPGDASAATVRLAVDESSAFRKPQVADFRPGGSGGGAVGVVFFVAVESRVGKGRGVVRMVETEKGVWKIWTVFTSLEEVGGFEEATGPRREMGVEEELGGAGNWAERRRVAGEFREASPDVLIIGAGQGGLTAAARLRMLGISTLIIDKVLSVGDNWRNRYRHLVLHDPVWYDHMPYMAFPPSWPVYTPKDKLADWFQAYVDAMDLNVWTASEIDRTAWDANEKRWTVDIRRVPRIGQPELRTLHPKHIIMATGHSGKPHMPSIPGMSSFKGEKLCHSSDFIGTRSRARGTRAVVVGACNSALDICTDYVQRGYDVTVVQRSSTFVISSATTREVSMAVLYEEGGPPVEDADLAMWSYPSEVLKALQVDLTSIAAERDRDVLDGLEKAGFRVDYGPSGGGIFAKYLQRGGGYYIDVGAAKLIMDGKITVKHGEVAQVLPGGVKLDDGTELEADDVIFATGYDNMRTTAEEVLGDALPDSVGDVWGWDAEGEMRGIWRDSGHPGLWFHGGNLALARYYSRLVALQILARLKGLEGV